MKSSLIKTLEKPELYTKSTVEFWNDSYISEQMLRAHLNPDFDGASRKLEFIERSAAWINKLLPPSAFSTLLDVGCGPGIYAEQFAKLGYQVTGVDFSERSIRYAIQSAQEKMLDISYLYQDYLKLDLKKQFDASVMIYCDYGALSTADRHTVLKNIHRHLKPGGCLLLDVFSMERFHRFGESQTWELCPEGGFWLADSYLEMNGCYRYLDRVTLEMHSIFSEKRESTYYLWNTCFSQESLVRETREAGFIVRGIYGDVAGKADLADSETIAILLEKYDLETQNLHNRLIK